jgi:hypothetical protein
LQWPYTMWCSSPCSRCPWILQNITVYYILWLGCRDFRPVWHFPFCVCHKNGFLLESFSFRIDVWYSHPRTVAICFHFSSLLLLLLLVGLSMCSLRFFPLLPAPSLLGYRLILPLHIPRSPLFASSSCPCFVVHCRSTYATTCASFPLLCAYSLIRPPPRTSCLSSSLPARAMPWLQIQTIKVLLVPNPPLCLSCWGIYE